MRRRPIMNQRVEHVCPPQGLQIDSTAADFCESWNLGQVCKTKLRIAERCIRYPFDFNARGTPLEESIGRVAYRFNRAGELCYTVVCRIT